MAGGIQYTLSMNAQPMLAALGAARSALASFNGVAGKVAAFAGLAGGVGLAGAAVLSFKRAIDQASNMETLKTSFSVLLGSMENASELMQQLSNFADQTPFELPEVADSTRRLLAYGFAQKEVLDTMRSIGDIASAVAVPLTELAEVYGTMRVQNRLYTQDVRQLVGRGIPVIQEFAKQFGVTEEAVLGLVEGGQVTFAHLQRAFMELTAAGGKFGGMMDKQSITWKGLLSTLIDKINLVYRAFGEPVMDALKPVLKEGIALAQSMQPMAAAWGKSMGEAIAATRDLFRSGDLGEVAALSLKVGFGEAVLYLSGKLQAVIQKAGKTFSEIASGAKDVATGKLGGGADADANRANIGAAWMGMGGLGFATASRGATRSNLASTGMEKVMNALSAWKDLGSDIAQEVEQNKARIKETVQAARTDFSEYQRNWLIKGVDVPRELPALPDAVASKKDKAEVLTDRLAKIGGFIGGPGGPRAQKAAEDTARNTGRLVREMEAMSKRWEAIHQALKPKATQF